MRRFATAAEQSQIPEFIENKFFKGSNTTVVNDKYAHLRERSQENQQRISLASSTYERDRNFALPEQTWATEKPAATYENRSLLYVNEDMSNVTAYDASASSIRRATYDVDDTLNRSRSLDEILNDSTYANLTHLRGDGDARSALGRHASIFGSNVQEIKEICTEKMDEHLNRFDRKSALQKKMERHNTWEQEQMTTLASARRPDMVSASQVLHTGNVEYSNSAFGLPNISQIDSNDAEKLRVAQERRAHSLGIARNGKSPNQRRAERHAEWQEEKSRESQRSYQGCNSSWIEAHINSMLDED